MTAPGGDCPTDARPEPDHPVPVRRRWFRSTIGRAAAMALPGSGAVSANGAHEASDARHGAPRPLEAARPLDAPRPLDAARPDVATRPAGLEPAALSFAFIGDLPYGRQEERALERILAGLPADELEFVLHVGDIKARHESCDDGVLSHRLGLLDAAPLPLIYTPGDNEWTDCRVADSAAAWSDPLGPGGRLRWLRQHAFAADRTLGRRTLPVERQGRTPEDALRPRPRLPENLRWQAGGIQFCSLHVIGSDNGLDGVPGRDRRQPFAQLAFDDWAARQQANGRWLFETLELAERRGAAALAIAIHANLRFGRGADDGYRRMRELIAQAANRFRRPMLLLHGDTHLYRIGRPLALQGLPHLLQVECFGSPFVSTWLRIDWNPARTDAPEGPFRITAHHV